MLATVSFRIELLKYMGNNLLTNTNGQNIKWAMNSKRNNENTP